MLPDYDRPIEAGKGETLLLLALENTMCKMVFKVLMGHERQL